ncbi:MAG: alpha/beta fold hydrolase [Anaerolineales bacterium]|nr:alpha/beta fold hydrolase [Anaerolineales bacterium]
MNKKIFILGLLMSLIFMGVLSACNSTDVTPTPTEVAVIEEATPVPATEEPTAVSTETAVPTETAAPTETAVPTETPEPEATATTEAEPTEAATTDTLFTFVPASCQFDEPVGFDVECGYVTMPETHADPENGRTVRLHVAIFKSDSDNPEPDPIVYLEGGPGADALETVPLVFADRFAPFLANRDFIMFDQRGTGYSEPSLACPEYTELAYDSLDLDLPQEEEIAMTVGIMQTCHDRLAEEGVNFAAYNSAENAADLAALRIALSYDEWNVYGISYGTRLAQTLMRDDPSGVRSIILDSSYPLSASLVTDFATNADRAFDTFFAGCAADAECNATYPDLETVFFDLVAQLDETPITLPVTNFLTGENYEALLGGDDLIGILFQSLYSAEIIPILPQLIYEVRDGNTQNLGLLLSSFMLNSEFFSIGMQYSVQCNEENSFSAPGEGEASIAEFPNISEAFISGAEVDDQVCAFWGAGEADAIENEAVQSDLPTLILAGEYDPITPPAWGVLVGEGLSSAFFYEFPGLGHGVSVSGDCPLSVTLAFLDDPTAAPDATCIAEMGGPAFEIAGAADEEITLVPFTADLSVAVVAGVVPEGWTDSGFGIFARGRTALDQTLILQQAVPGFDSAMLVELLSGQLELEGTTETVGSYETETLTWSLYELELQGLPVDIGVAEDDSYAYVVLLISSSEERDFLYTAVFQPAMSALNVP